MYLILKQKLIIITCDIINMHICLFIKQIWINNVVSTGWKLFTFVQKKIFRICSYNIVMQFLYRLLFHNSNWIENTYLVLSVSRAYRTSPLPYFWNKLKMGGRGSFFPVCLTPGESPNLAGPTLCLHYLCGLNLKLNLAQASW